MSYEGYEVALCESGHKRSADCYSGLGLRCDCGAGWAWECSIDQTNGCEHPTHVEQVAFDGVCHQGPWSEKTPAEFDTCNLGHLHLRTEATYHVPKWGRQS
jgi:hypothetical protein